VNGAPLQGCAKHLARSHLQALMAIADHQLNPAQAPCRQRSEDLVQNGSASDGPTAMPRTWRRPSAFAPTAIMMLEVARKGVCHYEKLSLSRKEASVA
jgi:hypothetical protein